ncbi:hypothetical protein J6590_078829 [Homalodisca vitripennis]|nr:hypothetical protein J6590_078829 [Homalodisca vitripennis]
MSISWQQGKLYIGVRRIIHLNQKWSYTDKAYEKRAKPRETASSKQKHLAPSPQTWDHATTTNGQAGGLLEKNRIAQRSPIQAAATLDVA